MSDRQAEERVSGPFVHAAVWLAALACLACTTPVDELDPRHAPGYARTSWATLHADSSNSDYVPLVTATDVAQEWRVLEGAALVTAPSVAADGRLFVTSGRGKGFSHLHAISPEGEIVWESPLQRGPGDLDAGAALSAPLLDDAGHVYVGDSNQYWSFDRDGRTRWVADLGELGAQGPFASSMIVAGRVGGITVHGQVLLFDRETGVLAAPLLDLPGGPSPAGPVPDFIWQGGLVEAGFRTQLLEVLLGYRYEVTNTPAVHPRSGRVYLVAGGRTPEAGIFYGIDFVGGALRIAFETSVGPGSGTSPAISADGTRVYAFSGAGEIVAIDADSGETLFERAVGGTQASPTVAPDGGVYVLAESHLRKLDGASGREIWARNYDEFAFDELPSVEGGGPLLTSGDPVARLDSVVTLTPNAVWVVLLCGYELRVAGRDVVHAVRTYLVVLEPRSGELLDWVPLPDSAEGTISVGRHGELYVDLLAIQASVAAHVSYRDALPALLRVEPPRGGLIALAPRSQRPQVGLGLGWAGRLLAAGARARTQQERDFLVLAQSQLGAALESMELAKQRGDMTAAEDSVLGGAIGEAVSALEACRAGDVGEEGCAALPTRSRTLRALGAAFR